MSRRALLAAVLLLVAAGVALGGAAVWGWARVGFQVPFRGTVPVRVTGSDLAPVLGPLALLALAAVAAVVATGGRTRRMLGAVLLVPATVPVVAVARVTEERRLVQTALTTGVLPARSVPDGTLTVLLAGPASAAAGALLLAGASVLLVLGGHRMPRMGRRYRTPTARACEPSGDGTRREGPHGGEPDSDELWERIEAGEDPTVAGDPR